MPDSDLPDKDAKSVEPTASQDAGGGGGAASGGFRLDRETLLSGALLAYLRQNGHGHRILTDEQIRESLTTTLSGRPPDRDVWLFGYGSLIWNPTINHVERRVGRIRGYHRRFCLWTDLGRGTPEQPGLMLGLDRGGSCRGVVFRVAAADVEAELELVWRREMVTGAYRPSWVTVETADGPLSAITFVINREHDRYAGLLDEERVASVLATAAGPLGSCAEYLFNTAAHLKELGLADARLERLRHRVDSRLGAVVCGGT